MKPTKKLILAAAAIASLMSATAQADTHTITVNATVNGTCRFMSGASTVSLTLDPTATTTVSQTGSVLYRCTKGTAPTFALASGSTNSSAGGTLGNAGETIPYTFSSSASGAGTGMGAGQDRTLSVTVTVDQTDAANVTPATYTDTIVIDLTP